MDHRDGRFRQFVERLAEAHRDDRGAIVLLRPLPRQPVQPVDVGAGLEMLARRRGSPARAPTRRSPILSIAVGHRRAADPRRRRSRPPAGSASVSRCPRSSMASRKRFSLMTAPTFAGSVLAPHTSTPTARAVRRPERPAQQRRKRGRAARFGDQAQPVPDQPLRRGDRSVRHQHGGGDVRLGDREHQLADLARAQTVRRQPAHRRLDRAARRAARRARRDSPPARR